jgi:hypothetical protein
MALAKKGSMEPHFASVPKGCLFLIDRAPGRTSDTKTVKCEVAYTDKPEAGFSLPQLQKAMWCKPDTCD